MPTHYQGTPEEIRALNAYIKLTRATESVHARVHQSSTMKGGLSVGQFGVLETLLHLGPMHQRELGRKLLRSHANMTTVLDNLERDGLISRERETEDRRFITVSLTQAGRRRIEEMFPGHVAAITAAMQALTPQEQERLGRLCKKLGLGPSE